MPKPRTSGANRSADAIGDASSSSTAEQRRQFDIATGLTQPSIDAGNSARDQLMRLLGLSPTGGGGSGGAGYITGETINMNGGLFFGRR